MKPLAPLTLAAVMMLPASVGLAQDRISVILDWFVNPNHGPIVLADALGYFDEAGLDVEIVTPADPTAPPRMVAAGQADLAVTYQPQLHLNLHEGMPLIRVGTLVSSPLACLATLADAPIETMADFEGRTVGFAVAGVQEAMLDAMLRHHDLDGGAVEQVNISWSISPALMSGQVDGVIGAFRNFELNQLALEGVEGRCFNPEDEGIPLYDELIYVANPDTMDADIVERFLEATARATAVIAEDPDAAWETFSATATELQTELNRLAWADTWPLYASDPMAVDAARYAEFEAFLHDVGLIPAINPTETVTMDVRDR